MYPSKLGGAVPSYRLPDLARILAARDGSGSWQKFENSSWSCRQLLHQRLDSGFHTAGFVLLQRLRAERPTSGACLEAFVLGPEGQSTRHESPGIARHTTARSLIGVSHLPHGGTCMSGRPTFG